MSFIETRHTRGAFEKLKNEMRLIADVINFASMAIFTLLYGYLMYINVNSIFHLVVYSLLITTIIASFVVELVMKKNESDQRKEKRIKEERKRIISIITKAVKYLAKTAVLVFGLYNEFIIEGSSFLPVANVISAVVLVVQVVADLVMMFVLRHLERFMMAVDLDIESSGVTSLYTSKSRKAQDLEDEISILKGESIRTEKEDKLRKELIADGEKFEVAHEKDKEELKTTIKTLKKEKKALKKGIREKEKAEKKAMRKSQELVDMPDLADNTEN